jgi:predicted O-methyltransferase YrrM
MQQPSKPVANYSVDEFAQAFANNLATCQWRPHALYSVFTQYDQEYYLAQKQAFMHKYRCFYAVSKTIQPRRIIELGASAGSSGDAYLSAAPGAEFIGIDVFGTNPAHDGTTWDPYRIAETLFKDRGFKRWQLIRVNLRHLERLPAKADFVVVDASHDFENEYADLKLALTADPQFIFVDDADDENDAKPAIDQFLKDFADRIEFTFHIEYLGGGLVIKLKNVRARFPS